MSAETELISRLFVLIDARQWNSLDEVFTCDAQYHRPGFPVITSIEDLRTFYEKIRPISAGQHTLYDIMADDVRGCCRGHFDGWGKSGKIIAEDFAEWYEFSGCTISVRRTFFFRPAV
jgi:uncharacterized protein